MTLAMIDLDRFKMLNDTFGHRFGDACLRHVAALLKNSFRRDTDIAIRYGGEELVVINSGASSIEMIERLNTFRRTIDESVVELDGVRSRLTLSIGVWSGVPNATDDFHSLLANADAALYRAKERGRNQVVVAGSREPLMPGIALAGSAPHEP